MEEKLRNPITGEQVDEIIKEKEAKIRGYLDLQFMMRHLEDENEFTKLFIINGKKISVDMDNPLLQYKKPILINHERVLQTPGKKTQDVISDPISTNTVCTIDDEEGCVTCGS